MSRRRKNGRRKARLQTLKSFAGRAAPVVRKVYEAGGKDALELAAGVVPGGAIAAKAATKAIDVLMSRPKRKAKLGAEVSLERGTNSPSKPSAQASLEAGPPWYSDKRKLGMAAAGLFGLVAIGVAVKSKKRR